MDVQKNDFESMVNDSVGGRAQVASMGGEINVGRPYSQLRWGDEIEEAVNGLKKERLLASMTSHQMLKYRDVVEWPWINNLA